MVSDAIYGMLPSRSLRDFFNSRSYQFVTIRQHGVSQFALQVTKVYGHAIQRPVLSVPCTHNAEPVKTGWTERSSSVCCLDYRKEKRECT